VRLACLQTRTPGSSQQGISHWPRESSKVFFIIGLYIYWFIRLLISIAEGDRQKCAVSYAATIHDLRLSQEQSVRAKWDSTPAPRDDERVAKRMKIALSTAFVEEA
jgi:hypothetical protein